MTTNRNTAALILLCLITVASGAVARIAGSPRVSTEAFAALADRLHECPRQIGDWRVVESVSLSDNELRELRCHGYLNRIYQHQRTGREVQVAVLLGEPAGIAVHDPMVCYTNREYVVDHPPRIHRVEELGRTHRFWKTSFRRRTVDGRALHVYHAWSTGSHWNADKAARLTYARSPHLYKIQFVSFGTTPIESESISSFLTSFIRELRPCVENVATIQ